MNAHDYAELEKQLIDHEDLRLVPYLCTSRKWTIGVGYNISDRGVAGMAKAIGRPLSFNRDRPSDLTITRAEALRALRADILMFEAELRGTWKNYDRLDGVRQRAVIDFVFNLGIERAAKFGSAIRFVDIALQQTAPPLIEAGWTAVAFHMMDSVWSRQVDDGLGGRKGRADRVCCMVRKGQDPGLGKAA